MDSLEVVKGGRKKEERAKGTRREKGRDKFFLEEGGRRVARTPPRKSQIIIGEGRCDC